jgi:hypothetical protein
MDWSDRRSRDRGRHEGDEALVPAYDYDEPQRP